jgi:preprotein translocase subunit SecG
MKSNNSILWILGLVVVVVVVIVVLVLVFGKKKSGGGGGGGGGTTPEIKSYSFATVDSSTNSPWLIQTSYVVAYVDTTYTAINHGPISNVVTVSSATGTNPTFIVTLKDGYDVVVYRTAATDANTTPTPPDGKGTPFVIVPDKTNKFTDTSNPYAGPPLGPPINTTITWDLTKKKLLTESIPTTN